MFIHVDEDVLKPIFVFGITIRAVCLYLAYL